MKKAIVLLIMSASWCIFGMEKNQEASSKNKKTPEEYPIDQVLPELSRYIFPYYWDGKLLKPADQKSVEEMHDWYCEAIVDKRKAEAEGIQSTLLASQYEQIQEWTRYMSEKYNKVPDDYKELESIAITDNLSTYLENRLERIMTHKKPLCEGHKEAVDELRRWFHDFIKYQARQTRKARPKVMHFFLYRNIIGACQELEKQLKLPPMPEPEPVLQSSPVWLTFDSWPDFEGIIEQNKNDHISD